MKRGRLLFTSAPRARLELVGVGAEHPRTRCRCVRAIQGRPIESPLGGDVFAGQIGDEAGAAPGPGRTGRRPERPAGSGQPAMDRNGTPDSPATARPAGSCHTRLHPRCRYAARPSSVSAALNRRVGKGWMVVRATDCRRQPAAQGVRRLVVCLWSSSPRSHISACTRWMTSACGSRDRVFAPRSSLSMTSPTRSGRPSTRHSLTRDRATTSDARRHRHRHRELAAGSSAIAAR